MSGDRPPATPAPDAAAVKKWLRWTMADLLAKPQPQPWRDLLLGRWRQPLPWWHVKPQPDPWRIGRGAESIRLAASLGHAVAGEVLRLDLVEPGRGTAFAHAIVDRYCGSAAQPVPLPDDGEWLLGEREQALLVAAIQAAAIGR